MNSLSALTSGELAQLDTALSALDAALLVLLDRGIISEDDGVDLPELFQEVNAERERRSGEDSQYVLGSAMRRGEVVAVLRPDGQVGFAPTERVG